LSDLATYKTITVPKRGGGTRRQRVQVLASGKYKFVKNKGTTRTRRKRSNPTKRRRTSVARRRVKTYRKKASNILGRYGATGMLEDAAIGYFGTNVLMGMGYSIEQAMPMTRIIQGVAGKALGRRGSGRLAYGLIDLLDVYLIKRGFNLQGISLRNWA